MSKKHIALVGNPNAGKSTVFNLLTGMNQKVANYPGVTVDKKLGNFKLDNGQKVEVVDLPGTYSLQAKSEDERIALNYLLEKKEHLDLVIVIADASNLKRNLLLFTQVYDLGLPVLLVLNMIDVADTEGISIDEEKLSSLLAGLSVLKLNAKDKNSKAVLKEAIESFETPDNWQPFHEKADAQWLRSPNGQEAAEAAARYEKIDNLLKFSTSKTQSNKSIRHLTEKIDGIVTHRIWGFAIFTALLFLMFQAIYKLANWPMDLIDFVFAYFGGLVNNWMPPGILRDLVSEGIIPGLGGVIIFIPQITLLFLFLAILEETGYMTRVVFIMDKLMKPFGLSGKSVVPLISGAACAIPAIMSTRSIEQQKDRLVTILVTPLMSCSARLPVYTLMIALAIPEKTVFGFMNLQGLVLLFMYFLGLFAALIAALVFKWIIQPGRKSFLIMEMPLYQMPRFKNVALMLLEKVKVFVFGAGKIILAISIILWVLGSYGPDSFNSQNETLPETEFISKVNLEDSYIGLLGQTIEPVIKPLGYDWKMGIALITSFAAREVFVGTMATIYSIGEEDTETLLIDRMRNETKWETRVKAYGLATGLSLMIFYAFAMQCMSTLAIVKRETKTWKWPLVQLSYMTAMAYFGALAAYQIGLWLS